MIRPVFLCVIAAFAIAGCSGRDDTAEQRGATSNEASAMAEDTANAGESSASMAAADFAAVVAASDMYEIESGSLAAEKASSADLKAMGQMLVADHQKSTADLKGAAAEARPAVAVMPVLTSEQRQMLEALRLAGPDQFDRTFVEQQKQAHRKALDLLGRYASEGDVAALKAFAAKAAPVVRKHFDELEKLNP